MSMSPIASANSPSLTALSPHGHGHRHGVHGDTQNDATNSTNSTNGPSGSTPNLFGSLMDSFESVMGLSPAAANTGSNQATPKR